MTNDAGRAAQARGVGRSEWERETTSRTGAGAVDDPYPLFETLRKSGAVHRGSTFELFGLPDPTKDVWPDAKRFTTVNYAVAEQVLRDAETFSNAGIRRMTEYVFGPVSLMGSDDPYHRKYRLLVQPAFARKTLGMWSKFVRPRLDELIDGFVGKGRTDLYFDYCAQFPVYVIAMALGVRKEDLEQFHEWAAKLQIAAAPPDEARAAREAVQSYMLDIVNDRRRAPIDDLITLLVQSEIDEGDGLQKLSDEQILGLISNLLPAGAGTTYRSLGIALVTLLERPELLARLYKDRTLVPAVVEEVLRWNGPVLVAPPRLATRDTELAGIAVPKGSIVEACIAAANRDPAHFENPQVFDPFRPEKSNLSFSTGPHFCVGSQVARMELVVALNAILDRLPDLRFDPEKPAPTITGLWYRMPTGVPAMWTA